jgi:hypothetical protein
MDLVNMNQSSGDTNILARTLAVREELIEDVWEQGVENMWA